MPGAYSRPTLTPHPSPPPPAPPTPTLHPHLHALTHSHLLQLTGSVKGKARTVLNEALARGDIEIAVGTHALISDSTQFARLGLAVVDEQHK